MKTKRIVSVCFVYLAMACLLAHAFVPHCHCADGRTVLLSELDECHLESCHHHHCEDCNHETHYCHNHHAHDHDEDCVLDKPFVKSADVTSKIAVPSVMLLSWMVSDHLLQPSILQSFKDKVDRPPLLVQRLYRVEMVRVDGLRAPPCC